MTKSPQSPSIKRAFFVSIPSLLFLIFLLGKYWLSNKCSIIDCNPATWNQIQEIIIKNSNSWGTEYRLEDIDVFPNIDNSGEIEGLNYVVYYVSMKPESTSQELNFKRKQIRFDNLNLWIDHDNMSLPATSLPASENILKLRQTVQPEDVITSTYDLATEALGQPTSSVMLKLAFADKEANTGTIWEIIYFGDNKKQVHYVVDAQSGKIVDTK